MQKIICDASSLISLSENCMLSLLPKMKADFIIPLAVKRELVDKPLNVYEFELKALRLRKAINDGIIKLDTTNVRSLSDEIMHEANSLFDPKMRIVHKGEADCLALMKKLDAETLLIDERTTRMLIECPSELGEYIRRKTHSKAILNEEKAMRFQKRFSDIHVIRSSEIAAYAYDHGLFEGLGDGKCLHACLYALKFSGCAITRKEINQYIKLLA